MDHRDAQDFLGKRNISCSVPGLENRIVQPLALSLYRQPRVFQRDGAF